MVNLAFFFVSDAETLRIVWSVTILFFAITLLVLVTVLLMRAALILRERRRQRFLTVWQPILVSAVDTPTSNLPRLARRDLPDFLQLWNHLHASLLDKSKEHLNQIARALELGPIALRMLRHRNLSERLIAIVTLGELKEPAAWDELWRMTQHEGALVSLTAAQSLVMIDSAKAMPQLIPLLLTRADWPPARVAEMLVTAGPEAISDQLADAAIKSAVGDNTAVAPIDRERTPNYAARMVRYLELVYTVSYLPAARTIARSSHDPEVLAACLRLLRSAEDLPVIRKCVTHEDWRVRLQAASALGRIGADDDEHLLVPLLSDRQWWVRYRAAQSLARLPSMVESKLRAIQTSQANPFARDMLGQVIAEMQLQ